MYCSWLIFFCFCCNFWTGWLRLIDFTAVIEWEPNVGLIHRVGFSAIVVRCHHFSPLFFFKLLIQYVQIKSIDNWWCDLLKSLNFFIVLCINCPCYMYHMKSNAWFAAVLSYQYPLVLLLKTAYGIVACIKNPC